MSSRPLNPPWSRDQPEDSESPEIPSSFNVGKDYVSPEPRSAEELYNELAGILADYEPSHRVDPAGLQELFTELMHFRILNRSQLQQLCDDAKDMMKVWTEAHENAIAVQHELENDSLPGDTFTRYLNDVFWCLGFNPHSPEVILALGSVLTAPSGASDTEIEACTRLIEMRWTNHRQGVIGELVAESVRWYCTLTDAAQAGVSIEASDMHDMLSMVNDMIGVDERHHDDSPVDPNNLPEWHMLGKVINIIEEMYIVLSKSSFLLSK